MISLFSNLKGFLQRCSLTTKMLVLTLVVSFAVWFISDTIHTYRLESVFRAKLSERFSQQAERQRIMFDQYVKGHHKAVMLFRESQRLKDYVSQENWLKKSQLKDYQDTPPWLPRLSIVRSFIQPRYFLLLDSQGEVREIFQEDNQPLPREILKPSKMLLALSHNQGYLTTFNYAPYIIASARVSNGANKQIATLMLVSPLDEEFLIASQGSSMSNTSVIALLAENEPTILVSSNSSKLPPGVRLDSLSEQYLQIGQGFFDYGATDVIIELVSFVSTKEVEMLTNDVLQEERPLRGLTAFAFILVFVSLMYMVTKRLKKFTSFVVQFSRNLHIDQGEQQNNGDEITILEDNFYRMAKAVESETAALEHQALHDPLTDLPNRKLLHNRLQQEILRGQRSNKSLVLIMSDLNHFKEINDTLGHHIGDLVLQKASVRLFKVFRKTDSVARLGGDEFGVLLPETNLGQARALAKKVLDEFNKPFVVEGHTLSVGISMGLAECPMHGDDVNILVQRADVAMYLAKRNNLGYTIYDPNKDTHSIGRLALMSEFRDAIENESLDIFYQPKVDMYTRKVVGAEALLRWHHPQRGYIKPDDFSPLAEQTGLIRPLTHWLLEQTVRQCIEWKKIQPNFKMAVNISVQTLHEKSFLDLIKSLIVKYSMSPSCLTLEITESDIMTDPLRAREILENLSMMGIHLAIDDFGTGYSSLSYIKQLPVEEIKIDRSFVMEMTEDENDAVIVHATIDLAHNLGLTVVAEGVKNEQTWHHLTELNCDVAQGFHISEALTAELFAERFLGVRPSSAAAS
jgi:diguanylate cyclase (GGDEF)-like protein